MFEDVYPAQDSSTLEQLKELSSRRVNVESINSNRSITEAIAREMSGGLTTQCEQVTVFGNIFLYYYFDFNLIILRITTISILERDYLKRLDI